MEELATKVDRLRPVVRIHEAHFHLVDEAISAFLFDLALRLPRLIRANVIVCQRVVDDLQSHLDRDLV